MRQIEKIGLILENKNWSGYKMKNLCLIEIWIKERGGEDEQVHER